MLKGLALQAGLSRLFEVGAVFLDVFSVEAFFVGKEANEATSLFFDERKIAFCWNLLHDFAVLGLLSFDVHQTVKLSQLYL